MFPHIDGAANVVRNMKHEYIPKVVDFAANEVLNVITANTDGKFDVVTFVPRYGKHVPYSSSREMAKRISKSLGVPFGEKTIIKTRNIKSQTSCRSDKERRRNVSNAFSVGEDVRGKRVLVIDKRSHIAGNIYTEDVGGIAVHRYGAHIFHTDDEEVWQYANRFATFNRFTNAPLAKYQDRLYHMPFNMNTFYAMWGVTKPNEAREIIERQRKEITGEPQNLEEQAISLVGRDIYEALVRGYSEKQWGRPCRELPAFIIRRLPVRFTYDNNYFNDRYQGIPDAGYTAMVEKMLDGIEVRLNVDFLQHRAELTEIADKIVYTGPIDQYYDQCFGALNYRSLRFETQDLPVQDYQGNAVINDTNADVPYTRVIEHKHFAYGQADVLNLPHTVVTYEYPADWKQGDEP